MPPTRGPHATPRAVAGELARARDFYEREFRHALPPSKDAPPSLHHRRLARLLRTTPQDSLLDVACGGGDWLAAATDTGARVAGLDLSCVAIHAARRRVADLRAAVGDAARLPFPTSAFDVITCLGALEHLADPLLALREMSRTARPGARFLLLVPNRRFIGRLVARYPGTEQRVVRESARTIEGWTRLFAEAGLRVIERWRDLHVVSWRWITRPSSLAGKLRRLTLATALPLVPTPWQYQIYFICRRANDPAGVPTR